VTPKSEMDYLSLLQGRYEAEHLPQDFSSDRAVPDFAFNFLNLLGLLYRPIVDEHHISKVGKKPTWPENKSFAVCLTHDVDIISLYSPFDKWKARKEQIKNSEHVMPIIKHAICFGLDILRSIASTHRSKSINCFERWLEIEKTVGAHSTFFFWPGWKNVKKHHFSDCLYDLSDKLTFESQKITIAELMREIDRRGWEIGLHASWYSFDDPDEMKRQKEALEKAVEREIVSVRQHYLHYDIRVTPRVQELAGFKFDSTLGFNDNVGFRFGTCHPWRLFDLKAERELSILEVPLIIQDGALLNQDRGMRLDAETAFRYIRQLTDAVKRVGGVLTLLWHPHYIMNPVWFDLYIHTLHYLQGENAWFASVQEIAKHVIHATGHNSTAVENKQLVSQS